MDKNLEKQQLREVLEMRGMTLWEERQAKSLMTLPKERWMDTWPPSEQSSTC